MICSSLLKNKTLIGPYFVDPCVPLFFMHVITLSAKCRMPVDVFTIHNFLTLLQCPPVAVAIARERKRGESFSQASRVVFNAVDLADSMGWESGPVKRELKLLQWDVNPAGEGRGQSLIPQKGELGE